MQDQTLVTLLRRGAYEELVDELLESARADEVKARDAYHHRQDEVRHR